MSSNRFIRKWNGWQLQQAPFVLVRRTYIYRYTHREEFVRSSSSMRNRAIQISPRFTAFAWANNRRNEQKFKISTSTWAQNYSCFPLEWVRLCICGKIHYHNNMKYASRKNSNVFKMCVCVRCSLCRVLVRVCLCVCVCVCACALFFLLLAVRMKWKCVAAIPSSLVAHNGPTHLPLTQRILHKRRSPNGPTSPGKRISVTSSKWMLSSSSSSSSSSDSSVSSGECGT